MPADPTPARRPGRPRGPRRSADAARRLEAARRRNLDQLATQRARNQAVDAALAAYITAEDAIHQAETDRDARIAPLQDRIAGITSDTERRIRELRQQQARSAGTIRGAGRSAKQVAELLDLSPTATRELLAAGRTRTRTPPATTTVLAPVPAPVPAEARAEP